jgi:2,5-dihydroxypyridine 5,6-dioxygenase
MSLDQHADLTEIFTEELRLCGVGPGASVGVLTQGMKRGLYAERFQEAAGELDATAFHVDIPSDGAPDDGGELGVRAADTGLASFNEVLVETFSRCDLMVDLVFLLWSEEQHAIKSAGTRIISCVEPPQVLRRLFPNAALRRRVLAARELLEGVSRLRVSDEAGTDVTYELGEFGYIHQYGMADEPGRWDHFASALVGTVGNTDGVNGMVVLKPGDILFPHSRYIGSPVKLTIKAGRVTSVSGGFDAGLISDNLARYDDDDAYGISHIGWGMNERARWDALTIGAWEQERAGTQGVGMDSRSFFGSVMFSTGPNVEFGGANNTACHMDMPMQACSLWLDEQQIIDRGRVLPVQLQPDSAGESVVV